MKSIHKITDNKFKKLSNDQKESAKKEINLIMKKQNEMKRQQVATQSSSEENVEIERD